MCFIDTSQSMMDLGTSKGSDKHKSSDCEAFFQSLN